MEHRLNILIMINVFTLVVIMALLGLVLRAAPSIDLITSYASIDPEEGISGQLPDFRVYTSAICDNISGFTVCHDELFAECGNIDYRLPQVEGSAIFEENWTDFRTNPSTS